MPDAKMRPNIRVKREMPDESLTWGGKPVGFTCDNCEIFHDMYCREVMGDFGDDGICEYNPSRNGKMSCFPIRCKQCNTNYCKWKRIKRWKQRLLARFDYNSHRYVRMLTISRSGDKIYPVEIVDDMIEHWRTDLTTRFAKLRRSKYWKEHVDGGIWFFETTVQRHLQQRMIEYHLGTDPNIPIEDKVNPHLHVVLLGKYLDQQKLAEACEDQGLGLPWITARDGASENIHSALDYCMAYLNKTPNYRGRQRDTFGCMRKCK